ncbi:hypothetical protein J2X28_000693 [Kocuria rhizophila]|nr:hypothetical protein [Kocuria rhizophila]
MARRAEVHDAAADSRGADGQCAGGGATTAARLAGPGGVVASQMVSVTSATAKRGLRS